MSVYKMQIDRSLCVGCGACAMACKVGNNTQTRANGQTFNWADVMAETRGAFPTTKWQATPVRCNHCDDPKCVDACPVAEVNGRAAMYKDADTGLVLHDDDRCIGCRNCQRACPYSVIDVGGYKAQYSVISYNNDTSPHSTWQGTEALILDGTSTPSDVVAAAGAIPPYKNEWTFDAGGRPAIYSVRNKGVTEKCYFCAHRVLSSETDGDKILPYCVLGCAANALKVITDDTKFTSLTGVYANKVISGTDPTDPSAQVLAHGSMKRAAFTAKPSVGISRPNCYYVGDFSKR